MIWPNEAVGDQRRIEEEKEPSCLAGRFVAASKQQCQQQQPLRPEQEGNYHWRQPPNTVFTYEAPVVYGLGDISSILSRIQSGR